MTAGRDLNVLYEDNHILGVYKPSGVLVQADASKEGSLLDELKLYLKHKYSKPGNVYLGLVHRLDKQVEGVMVFAKTSKGASRLSEQFRQRTIEKEYLALVEGKVALGERRLEHYLTEDREENSYDIWEKKSDSKSKLISLRFECLKSTPSRSLLRIQLETGRKHQIRRQFAYIGHPIVGDRLYGAESRFRNKRVALIASKLMFAHPTLKKEVELVAEGALEQLSEML